MAGSGRAGVCLERCDAELFESMEQFACSAVVADPYLIVVALFGTQPTSDGLCCDFAGPVVVRPVPTRRIGVTGAVRTPATGMALGDRAGQDTPRTGDSRQFLGDLACLC